MPESGLYGSVRGARGNSRPYRDPRSGSTKLKVHNKAGYSLIADMGADMAEGPLRARAQNRCAIARCRNVMLPAEMLDLLRQWWKARAALIFRSAEPAAKSP